MCIRDRTETSSSRSANELLEDVRELCLAGTAGESIASRKASVFVVVGGGVCWIDPAEWIGELSRGSSTVMRGVHSYFDTMLAGATDTIGRHGLGCKIVDSAIVCERESLPGMSTDKFGLPLLAESAPPGTGRTGVKPVSCSIT